MSSDRPKTSFSKRHGFVQPREITIREDAPESLRRFALDQLVTAGYGPSKIREMVCSTLLVRPTWPNEWDETENLFYNCEWWNVYEFIETIHQTLLDTTGSREDRPEERAAAFENSLNEFLVYAGIGWKMIRGEIVTRGTEAFESIVGAAIESLEAAGMPTARGEIHEALMDLSRRPEADLTGATQHAMGALECVARDVCGDAKATLGEVIKRYPGTIPKPLDECVSKAWGFASEKARHIREGTRPDRKEVELVVSLAATMATYLSARRA